MFAAMQTADSIHNSHYSLTFAAVELSHCLPEIERNDRHAPQHARAVKSSFKLS